MALRRKTQAKDAGYGVVQILNLPGSLGTIVNLRSLFDAEIPQDLQTTEPSLDVFTAVNYALKISFLTPTAPIKVLDATVGKSVFGKVLTRWEGRVVDEEFISYSNQQFKLRTFATINYGWNEFSCDEPPTGNPPTLTGDFISASVVNNGFSVRLNENVITLGDSLNISLVVPCAGIISLTYAYQHSFVSKLPQTSALPFAVIGL